MENPRALGPRARTIVVFPASLALLSAPPSRQERERLPEAFERLWHQNDPNFERVAEHHPSRAEEVARAARRSPRAAAALARAAATESPRDIAALARALGTEPLSRGVRRACRTSANTSLGNRGELPTLERYAAMRGCVVRCPRHRFSMLASIDPARFVVEIRGRVDGVVLAREGAGARPGGEVFPEEHVRPPGAPASAVAAWMGANLDAVVEVKTRTRQLFGRPSRAELVQLNTYLTLLNARRGVLVERFGERVGTHEVFRDDALHARTMAGLRRFLVRFCEFLDDGAAQRRYLALPDRARARAVADLIVGERPAALWPLRAPAPAPAPAPEGGGWVTPRKRAPIAWRRAETAAAYRCPAARLAAGGSPNAARRPRRASVSENWRHAPSR
jgi:hypothetical protein